MKQHDLFQNYGQASWAPDAAGPDVREEDVRGGRMTYVYPAYDRSFCEGTIGFLDAYVRLYGATPKVTEEKCHARGDAACVFYITW